MVAEASAVWPDESAWPTFQGMNRDELRAVQQPLKDAYRDDPDAALITLRADGVLGEEGLTCSVDTGRQIVEAGLHPATGGDGTFACSGDLLLQALVACAGVTMRAVATSLGVDIDSGTVRAEGDLDFRGTLAVANDAPVGFRSIRLTFEVASDADDAQLETLRRLTERYCVVLQTLASPAQLNSGLTRRRHGSTTEED